MHSVWSIRVLLFHMRSGWLVEDELRRVYPLPCLVLFSLIGV